MNVQVSIHDGPESIDAGEAAGQILELLGGDPEKDICVVSIVVAPTTGTVGQPAPVEAPAE